MRALTLHIHIFPSTWFNSNNEVLAREGIDTILLIPPSMYMELLSNNEVLAREGIDTGVVGCAAVEFCGNNEVLAREGIDT